MPAVSVLWFKSVINSLEFLLNGIIRKNFRTRSNELVKDCLMYFNCVVADNIFRRKVKFLNKIKQANNSLCRLCLLYTSPSPRDRTRSRMPSSA